MLQEFYKVTLDALEDANNERLWFKTNLKLGYLWMDATDYGKLARIIKELHKVCARASMVWLLPPWSDSRGAGRCSTASGRTATRTRGRARNFSRCTPWRSSI